MTEIQNSKPYNREEGQTNWKRYFHQYWKNRNSQGNWYLEFETCPLVPCNGRRVCLWFDAWDLFDLWRLEFWVSKSPW